MLAGRGSFFVTEVVSFMIDEYVVYQQTLRDLAQLDFLRAREEHRPTWSLGVGKAHLDYP